LAQPAVHKQRAQRQAQKVAAAKKTPAKKPGGKK
jgi:hypothetical protein